MDIFSLVIGFVAGVSPAMILFIRTFSLQKEIQFLTGEKARYQAIAEHTLSAVDSLEKNLRSAREDLSEAEKNLISSTQENQYLREQLNLQKTEMLHLQERFKLEFEQLAQNILEEKSRKFTTHNEEKISALLQPLKEKIHQFEQKVENVNKDQIDRNATLTEQIKQLSQMHQMMSTETRNLTRALKSDTKLQGNWGELVLESILEKSGLRKGYEYHTQVSYTQENGQQIRPDIIVQLPDKKHIIIDSKVSLTAYEQFVNAENEYDRSLLLKSHIQSVRQHIRTLSGKNYQLIDAINTPDFVLLFIPIEPAFHAAIHEDQQLFQDAYDKNIIIVTTSTLLATLRTISSIWKQEYQNRNTADIANQAGRLYDKFVAFTEDILSVGKRIEQTQIAYDAALNKLSSGNGNLIRTAQKLKNLGVKSGKNIPQQLTGEDQDNEA